MFLTENDLIFWVYLRYGRDSVGNSIGAELLAKFCFERDAREFCKLYTKNRGDDVPRVFYRRLDNEN